MRVLITIAALMTAPSTLITAVLTLTQPCLVWANADDLVVRAIHRKLILNEVVGVEGGAFTRSTAAALTDGMMATYGVSIRRVEELTLLTVDELLKIQSLGPDGLKEITSKLSEAGARLTRRKKLSTNLRVRLLAYRANIPDPQQERIQAREHRRRVHRTDVAQAKIAERRERLRKQVEDKAESKRKKIERRRIKAETRAEIKVRARAERVEVKSADQAERRRREAEERAKPRELEKFRLSLAAGPTHLINEESGFLPEGVAARILSEDAVKYFAKHLTLAELAMLTESEFRRFFRTRPELADEAIQKMASAGLPFGAGPLLGLSVRSRILASRAGIREPKDLFERDFESAGLPLKPAEHRWLKELSAQVNRAIKAGRPVDADFAVRAVPLTRNDPWSLKQARVALYERQRSEPITEGKVRRYGWSQFRILDREIGGPEERLRAKLSESLNFTTLELLTGYMYEIHGIKIRSLEELTAVTYAELAIIPEFEWSDLKYIVAKLEQNGRALQSAGLPGLSLRNRIAAFRAGVRCYRDLKDHPERLGSLEMSDDERLWVAQAESVLHESPGVSSADIDPPLDFDETQSRSDHRLCSQLLETAHFERESTARFLEEYGRPANLPAKRYRAAD